MEKNFQPNATKELFPNPMLLLLDPASCYHIMSDHRNGFWWKKTLVMAFLVQVFWCNEIKFMNIFLPIIFLLFTRWNKWTQKAFVLVRSSDVGAVLVFVHQKWHCSTIYEYWLMTNYTIQIKFKYSISILTWAWVNVTQGLSRRSLGAITKLI